MTVVEAALAQQMLRVQLAKIVLRVEADKLEQLVRQQGAVADKG